MENKGPKCCVSGCINYKGSQPDSVTFHDFPNNAEENVTWLKALGFPESCIKYHAEICSIHFKDSDLIKTSAGTFIKLGAIPTQHIGYKFKKRVRFASLNKSSKDQELSVDCSGSTDSVDITALAKTPNVTMSSSRSSPILLDDDSLLQPLKKRKTKNTPKTISKTNDSPEKLVNVTFFDDTAVISSEDCEDVSNRSFEAEETKLIPYQPPKSTKRVSAESNKLLQPQYVCEIDTSDDDWSEQTERLPKKKGKKRRFKKTAPIPTVPTGPISKPPDVVNSMNKANHNSNSGKKNSNPVCIAGCINDEILFPLPRDYKVANLWLDLLDTTNLKAKEIRDGKYWICANHFSSNMKDETGTKLLPWAMPDNYTTKQTTGMSDKPRFKIFKINESTNPIQHRPTTSRAVAHNNSPVIDITADDSELQSYISSIPAIVTIKPPTSTESRDNKKQNFVVITNQETVSSELINKALGNTSILDKFQQEIVKQLETNNRIVPPSVNNLADLPQQIVVQMVFLTVDKTDFNPTAALLKQMKALKLRQQRVNEEMPAVRLANQVNFTEKFSSINSVEDSIKLKAVDRNLKLKLIDEMPRVNGVPIFMQNNIAINTKNNFNVSTSNTPDTFVAPKPLMKNRQIQCTIVKHNEQSIKIKKKHKQTTTESTVMIDKCISTDDYDDDFEQYLIQDAVRSENSDFRYIDDGQCVCNHCEKIFASSSHARRHIEQHKDKSLLCYKCGKLCVKHMAMFQHEAKCNGSVINRRGRVCTIRSLTYDAETELIFPTSPKLEDKTCNICGKVSDCMIKHLDHMNKHTGNRPHKCTCGATFRSTPSFYAHRKRFGCSGKNSDFAPYGVKLGTRKTKAEREQLEEKSKKKRVDPDKYYCAMCNVRCPNYVTFRAHRRKHNTERNHVCPECNNTYKDAVSLKQHIHQRHLKKSVCTVCNKKCTPHYLTIHMRTHTGERPYSCVVCKEKFISMTKLQAHKRTVHNIGEIKKPERKLFPCSICSMKFGFKKALQHHLERVEHLNKERAWKESIGLEFYTCEYCSVSYEFFGTYAEHMGRAHNAHCFYKMQDKLKEFEERLLPPEYVEEEVIPADNNTINSYKCNLCQTNYDNQKFLEHHLFTMKHLKEEKLWKDKYGYIVFTCEICGDAFDKFGKYAKHSYTVHQTQIYTQLEAKFQEFQNFVTMIKHGNETIVEEIYYEDGHYDNIIEENDIDQQQYQDIIEEDKVDDIKNYQEVHVTDDVNMSDLDNLQANNGGETFQVVKYENDLAPSSTVIGGIDNSLVVQEMQGLDDYLKIKPGYNKIKGDIDVVN